MGLANSVVELSLVASRELQLKITVSGFKPQAPYAGVRITGLSDVARMEFTKYGERQTMHSISMKLPLEMIFPYSATRYTGYLANKLPLIPAKRATGLIFRHACFKEIFLFAHIGLFI